MQGDKEDEAEASPKEHADLVLVHFLELSLRRIARDISASSAEITWIWIESRPVCRQSVSCLVVNALMTAEAGPIQRTLALVQKLFVLPKKHAKLRSVENQGLCTSRTAGPSTTPLAKNASGFAQDDIRILFIFMLMGGPKDHGKLRMTAHFCRKHSRPDTSGQPR